MGTDIVQCKQAYLAYFSAPPASRSALRARCRKASTPAYATLCQRFSAYLRPYGRHALKGAVGAIFFCLPASGSCGAALLDDTAASARRRDATGLPPPPLATCLADAAEAEREEEPLCASAAAD